MNGNANLGTSPTPEPPNIKWILFAVLGVAVMAFIFYVIVSLGTPAGSANPNSTVTQVKNAVNGLLGNKSPGSPKPNVPTIVGLKQQNPLESGKNTYTFVGTYFNIDVANTKIYIKDSAGNVGVFDIKNTIYEDTSLWLRVFLVPNVETLAVGIPIDANGTSSQDSSKFLTMAIQFDLRAKARPSNSDIIAVRWNDTRSSSQIQIDYHQNPNNPMNAAFAGSTVLAEIQ